MVNGRIGMTSSALTTGTFEGFIKSSDKALVDFYDRTTPKMDEWTRGITQFGGNIDLHLNLDGGKYLKTKKNRMKM